jgi:hypothetical protein
MLTPGAIVSAEPLINYPDQGITVDTATGLMWQDSASIEAQHYAWDDAMEFCAEFSLAGHRDWRLPNIYELTSTVDNTANYPGGDIRADFMYRVSSVGNSRYWSATLKSSVYRHAMFIDYYYGNDKDIEKEIAWSVRCVRGPELSFAMLTELQAAGRLKVRRGNIDKFIEEPEYLAAQRARSKRKWQAFLKKYPNGYFANNAKHEMQTLGLKIAPFQKRE